MANDFTQWSTVQEFGLSSAPAWVQGDDRLRIAAYAIYEQMYWNVPQAFKLVQRGADIKPIYIPAAKVIVETTNRYLAKNMNIIADPNMGTPQEQADAMAQLTLLLRRERFYSMFSSNKRYGIMRGDWAFQIYADPNRDPGSRISILPVDPASIFPIYNEDNVDEIIGMHIAYQVMTDSGDTRIYRLTYRKETGTGGPSPITVSEGIFKTDDWGGPEMDGEGMPETVIRNEELLPQPINQIPIYTIRNFEEPGSIWGSSELRGLERVIAAINQSISDEELELVLNGLGVYTTDAGSPIDEDTGQAVPWNLGPARVVELPDGKKFTRVTGTDKVTPHQDHLKYLHDQLNAAVAQPAVARGSVDVQVAESGIALLLELGPLLSQVEEKELSITDSLTNLLFDLKAWFQAYENVNTGEAVWIPTYGDKIPVNRKQRFDEIMKMYAAKLVSGAWALTELGKLGYEFADATAMLDDIATEQTVLGQVASDVTGARLTQELTAAGGTAGGNGAG